MRLRMTLVVTVVVVLLLSGVSHGTELTIGLVPEQNVFKQVAWYRPVGDYRSFTAALAIQKVGVEFLARPALLL